MTEELKEDVIIRAEDIILGKKTDVTIPDVIVNKNLIKKTKESIKNSEKIIASKGKPKSGRVWKEQKTR